MDVRCKRKYKLRTMKILGIDPGISGAIAVLTGDRTAFKIDAVHDIPIKTETRSSGKIRRAIDPLALKKIIQGIDGIDLVVCEKLIPPPGRVAGSIQCFSMGVSQGVIQSVLMLLKFDPLYIYPHRWKKTLNIPASKEGARIEACKLFKEDQFWKRKKDHNRAESALLALYGLVSQGMN